MAGWSGAGGGDRTIGDCANPGGGRDGTGRDALSGAGGVVAGKHCALGRGNRCGKLGSQKAAERGGKIGGEPVTYWPFRLQYKKTPNAERLRGGVAKERDWDHADQSTDDPGDERRFIVGSLHKRLRPERHH